MASTAHVPTHGNYHGYYSKRPSMTDARITWLKAELGADFFVGKRVLDVGCNEGAVTLEIAQTGGATAVVGVDIDASLVRGAWRRRQSLWSTQGPLAGRSCAYTREDALDYFPASFEHALGPLPIPRATSAKSFPNNVLFRASDWVKDEIPEDKSGYDIVLGFSITKWIHLNSGDNGIRQFFKRVYDVLPSGGVFVLEAQPWDGYKKAKRVGQTPLAPDTLTLRPDDFGDLLVRIGFQSPRRLLIPGAGDEERGFRRPVDVYVKS
ncbi:Bin3-domain-containing protein [Cylindrobasidium torrendii FP15055 ss-10]|uniref:RNA methyltransferase n=1 Tax=Cylindrobasidium torrendii FP15055 ss-10 TaxID=1314674 RepID=A0A0D7B0C5_9AGAR|nr:Bin3-domain-containing protein [Cylindrobasidium torrendii FP15055 ss-10]